MRKPSEPQRAFHRRLGFARSEHHVRCEASWNCAPSQPTETSSALCPVSMSRITDKARLATAWRCADMATRDHGRDIAYFIDGVPVNEISSITHAQTMPTSISLSRKRCRRIEVVRGPFSVEGRRFQSWRRSIHHHEELRPLCQPQSVWRLVGNGPGARDLWQQLTEASSPILPPRLYHTDGYRDNSDIDRYNTFNKVTVPFGGGDTLTFQRPSLRHHLGRIRLHQPSALQSG